MIHYSLYYTMSSHQIVSSIGINYISYAFKIQEFKDFVIFEIMWPNQYLSNCNNEQYYGPMLIKYSTTSLDTTQTLENSILKSTIVGTYATTQKYCISIGFLNWYYKLSIEWHMQNTCLHVKNTWLITSIRSFCWLDKNINFESLEFNRWNAKLLSLAFIRTIANCYYF